MTVRLQELTPGGQVTCLVGGGWPVKMQAEWIGVNALRLTYHTVDDRLDERILYQDHKPRLDLHTAGPAYDFPANARLFKLAAEALRIRMAGRFAPMLALHTSNLEPLSHQIRAVAGLDGLECVGNFSDTVGSLSHLQERWIHTVGPVADATACRAFSRLGRSKIRHRVPLTCARWERA